MRNILIFIWETVKIAVIAAVIVIPVRYFIFQPFFVKGESMEPNFQNNNYLIIDEISYRFNQPERGDVIVFKYPNDPSQRYIKRIIGLPGEIVEIKNGKIFISDDSVGGGIKVLDETFYLSASFETPGNVSFSLGEDEYFVLGDNRYASSDSRRWGALNGKYIIGKVFLKVWPFAAFAEVDAPVY